ncbi:hypothetical protein EB118_12970 [bacterium]|nr:hypothetical protein [Actinomycetota bacterium]NDG30969.1 hypothetical protein [bacterium]
MLLPDIRNFANSKVYLPILTSAALVDTLGLFIWRYTSLPGSPINRWYDNFGLSAYVIDVLSIMLGVVLTQISTFFIGGAWNPAFFCFVAVAIQMTHDLFFGTVIVPFIPKGHNAVMDLMKDYVKIKNPGGILIVDALYMVFASLLTMLFYNAPAWISWFVLLWTLYVTGYILYTRAR